MPTNLLVIVLDDVGAETFGIYGLAQSFPATPRFDASAPQTEVFWRAYMEKLPRRDVLIRNDGSVLISKSDALRKTHADWFEK